MCVRTLHEHGMKTCHASRSPRLCIAAHLQHRLIDLACYMSPEGNGRRPAVHAATACWPKFADTGHRNVSFICATGIRLSGSRGYVIAVMHRQNACKCWLVHYMQTTQRIIHDDLVLFMPVGPDSPDEVDMADSQDGSGH
jgi:hypothetical protein